MEDFRESTAGEGYIESYQQGGRIISEVKSSIEESQQVKVAVQDNKASTI